MPKKILLTTENEFNLLTQFTFNQDTLGNKALKEVFQNQEAIEEQYKDSFYAKYFETDTFKTTKQTLDKINQHDPFYRAMCYFGAIKKVDGILEILEPRNFDLKTQYSFSEREIEEAEEIIFDSIIENTPLKEVLLSCVGVYDLVQIGDVQRSKDLLVIENHGFKDFPTFYHFLGSFLKQIYDQSKNQKVKSEIDAYWSFRNNEPKNENDENMILGQNQLSYTVSIHRLLEPNFLGEFVDFFPDKYSSKFKDLYSFYKDDLDFVLAIQNRDEDKVLSLLNKEKLDLFDMSNLDDLFLDVKFFHFFAKYLPTVVNPVLDLMLKHEIIPEDNNFRYKILINLAEKQLFDKDFIREDIGDPSYHQERAKLSEGLLTGLREEMMVKVILGIKESGGSNFDELLDYMSPKLLIDLIKAIPESIRMGFFMDLKADEKKDDRTYSGKVYKLFSKEKKYLDQILEAFGTKFKKKYCNHSISKLIELDILSKTKPDQIFSYAKNLTKYPETNLDKLYFQIKEYLNIKQKEEFKKIKELKKLKDKPILNKFFKPITNVLRKRKEEYEFSKSDPSDHESSAVELTSFKLTTAEGVTSLELPIEQDEEGKQKRRSEEDSPEKLEQRAEKFMSLTSLHPSVEETEVLQEKGDSKEGFATPSNLHASLVDENLMLKLPEVPTHDISEKKEKEENSASKPLGKLTKSFIERTTEGSANDKSRPSKKETSVSGNVKKTKLKQ